MVGGGDHTHPTIGVVDQFPTHDLALHTADPQ